MAEKVPGIKLEVEADNTKLKKGLKQSETMLKGLGKSADAQKIKIGGIAGSFAAVTGAMSTVEGASKALQGIFKGMNGDVSGMLDIFQTLPAGIGPAIGAVRGLWDELSGAAEEAERLVKAQEEHNKKLANQIKLRKALISESEKIKGGVEGQIEGRLLTEDEKIIKEWQKDINDLEGNWDSLTTQIIKAKKEVRDVQYDLANFSPQQIELTKKGILGDSEAAKSTAAQIKKLLTTQKNAKKTLSDLQKARGSFEEITTAEKILGIFKQQDLLKLKSQKAIEAIEEKNREKAIQHQTTMLNLEQKGESTLYARKVFLQEKIGRDTMISMERLNIESIDRVAVRQAREIKKTAELRKQGIKISEKQLLESLKKIRDEEGKALGKKGISAVGLSNASFKAAEATFQRQAADEFQREYAKQTDDDAKKLFISDARDEISKEIESLVLILNVQEDMISNIKEKIKLEKDQTKLENLRKELEFQEKLLREFEKQERFWLVKRDLAQDTLEILRKEQEATRVSEKLKKEKELQDLLFARGKLHRKLKDEAGIQSVGQIDYLSALDRGKPDDKTVDELKIQTGVLKRMDQKLGNIGWGKLP